MIDAAENPYEDSNITALLVESNLLDMEPNLFDKKKKPK